MAGRTTTNADFQSGHAHRSPIQNSRSGQRMAGFGPAVATLLLAGTIESVAPTARPQEARVSPNIVLVVIDDTRWDVLGVAGTA